jgi:elongation factor G
VTFPQLDAPTCTVAVIGHPGSGKIVLAGSLLAGSLLAGSLLAGSLCGLTEGDDGSERILSGEHLMVVPVVSGGVTVNLLVTSEGADVADEGWVGLRVADAALFVVAAADGIDPITPVLWEACAELDMPRAIAITGLDNPATDFTETLALCRRVFGDGVVPLHLPLYDDNERPIGLIDVLSQRLIDYSGDRSEREPDPEHLPFIADTRREVIEAILAGSTNDALLDAYLVGDPIDVVTVRREMVSGVTRGDLQPVVPTLPTGLGLTELSHLMTTAFLQSYRQMLPPVTNLSGEPQEPLSFDPAGPLVAEVIAALGEFDHRYVLRVFSGTLHCDTPVQVSRHHHGTYQQRGFITRVSAATPAVNRYEAGALCTVSSPNVLQVGDTISDPHRPLLMQR